MRILNLSSLLLLTSLAACTSDTPAGSGAAGGTDTGAADTSTSDTATADTATDTAVADTEADTETDTATDTAVEEVTGDPVGTPCTDDSSCASRDCYIADPQLTEGLCSQLCGTDADCPADWECIAAAGTTDAQRSCVPTNYCYDRDGDNFGIGAGCTGLDCDDFNEATNPQGTETCDGADNDCDNQVDDSPVGLGVACDSGFSGVCATGILACDGGSPVCNPTEAPSAELCDTIDNDCDGLIDQTSEGAPLARSCYEGPAGTEGVGLCAGGQQFCADGTFGLCENDLLPTTELCDGLDNDCDGVADNGDPGAGVVCSTGLPGLCGAGVTACVDGAVTCLANIGSTDEECDGRDNDCDGLVDEDADDFALTAACYGGPDGTAGLGICAEGFATCRRGVYGACQDQIIPATGESCDLLDNDCDGLIDEDNPGGGRICNTGLLGECALGETSCLEGTIACTPNLAASEEVCDGRDNDCDGQIDEDDTGATLQRGCYAGPDGTVGVGECRSGVQLCVGGSFGGCAGQVLPTTETCNERDDNCDGTQDEGLGVTLYADADADGYGDPAVSRVACTATAGWVIDNRDCYDGNFNANPAQTGYFTANRGDGSFDYNCNGAGDRQFTAIGSSSCGLVCNFTEGWRNSVPACGAGQDWLTQCTGGLFVICPTTYESRPQRCR